MGLLNKIMFWKKDDDFDFDKVADNQFNQTLDNDPLALNRDLAGIEEKSPFEQFDKPASFEPELPNRPAYPSHSTLPATRGGDLGINSQQRDLELVNSKLDTIKAILSSLDQRLANIERSSKKEERKNNLW